MPDAASLVVVAVLSLATPASGQTAPPSSDDLERLLGEFIRASGYECPVVKEIEPSGSNDQGDEFRVVCGRVNGPPLAVPTFRLTVPAGQQAALRVSPWW